MSVLRMDKVANRNLAAGHERRHSNAHCINAQRELAPCHGNGWPPAILDSEKGSIGVKHRKSKGKVSGK
jgi:hypothetical protein